MSLASLSLLVFSASGASGRQLARQVSVLPPPGFTRLLSETGVELYRKSYNGGYPDYVQVIDLAQGAQIELLHGPVQEIREGKGIFNGNDARFNSYTVQQYWQGLKNRKVEAFCVTNGQFFYMLEYPTRLPLPLKVDGQILTDGYEKNNFSTQRLLLRLWQDRADIIGLSKDNLYYSNAPNIVGGLTEDALKSPDKYVARTFVGISDRDGDGAYETVLIFNSKAARQADAAAVLRDFGAYKVMMLDGGGSTQLYCQGENIIESERFIPQAIGIVAGPPRTPAPTPTTQLDWLDSTEEADALRKLQKSTNTQTEELIRRTQIINVAPLLITKTATMAAIDAADSASDNNIGVIWVVIIISVIAPLIYVWVWQQRSKN